MHSKFRVWVVKSVARGNHINRVRPVSTCWNALIGACGRLNVLLVFLLLPAVNAQAQDAATIADIRCVIVGMQLAGVANSAQQPQGIVLTWYYIGRLEGRVPKLDIEKLLIEETGSMTSSDYALEIKRCGAELAEKGRQVTQIGKDLIEREQAKSAKSK